MTETQKRIRAYKKALPELRERVIAVALLLAMSMSMLTSASFAWLTISRSPEVTGVNTTVAANGNLEIALVQPDGAEPDASAVGDSSAAEGQSVTASNITWGNLVNLSDPTYGLDHLVLRPAQLNTASLLTSPLYGAVYTQDGRVERLTSNYAYTSWVPPKGNVPGYFGLATGLGVRAISSTKTEAVGFLADYLERKEIAEGDNNMAQNDYLAIVRNESWMSVLSTLMGVHMTATLNTEDKYRNAEVAAEDVQSLIAMYDAFITAFKQEAKALANLLNLELFLYYGGDTTKYVPYTEDMVLTAMKNPTKNGKKDFIAVQDDSKAVKVTNLETFLYDYNMLVADVAELRTIAENGDFRWKDGGLQAIVNRLVDINSCILDGKKVSDLMSEFLSNPTSAMGYMNKEVNAVITNGVLYNFAQRTGTTITVSANNSNGKKGLPVQATMYVQKMNLGEVTATVYATITTSATLPSEFTQDLTYADSLNTGADSSAAQVVAEDTCGLAIDLWVRTNAEDSYLTLEGNVLTETEDDVQVTGKAANGDTVDIYVLTTIVEDEGNSYEYTRDVYKQETKDANGNTVITWYDADNHSVLPEEALGDSEPVPKVTTVVTVVGYEGENRIWTENDLLSTDATTQGSGSCYVYYADTPEDQARSLKLLEAFQVAFIDQYGLLLAEAKMDTANYFAENGRVTVPLVLDPSSCLDAGVDSFGYPIYAIKEMEKNVPTRITAIVYLNGTNLRNGDVLSAADIQGQLNIQFGSTMDMKPIPNETLENQELRVSASLDKTSFNWDTDSDFTTNVEVSVDGTEPGTVTAFFLRAISETQGSREEVMTFRKNEDGKWVSSYAFTAPGNYVLRTVMVDGVARDLAEPLEVKVEGFSISSLSCQQAVNNQINIMTVENFSTVNLNLKFATNDVDKMPKSVQGRFLREDGTAANVNFVMDPKTQVWKGSATFLVSGDYTLQYLIMDGKYEELPSTFHQTAVVSLGMRVAAYTTSPHVMKYVPSEMAENEKLLAMQVKITDNDGKELSSMTGVKLIYGMKGSAKTMDTDLTWNGTYYTGAMPNGGPGTWVFSRVTVGGNILTTATTAPTFTVQSPEPPEYYYHNTTAYQYAPNRNAVMNAQITNSAAAADSVQAYIVNQTTNVGTWVDGAIGNEFADGEYSSINHWSFPVPTDANGYQDGNWKLTQLKLWNVFDSNGVQYTEENPLVFDVADTNNVTKVVNRIFVSIANDLSQDFEGAFMKEHTISGLSVDIKDFENSAVANISDVKLTFKYDTGSCVKYGGYSSEELLKDDIAVVVALPDDGTGTHFAQTENATLVYAGSYQTVLSFKQSSTTYAFAGVNDDPVEGTKALPANAPVFTVSSVTPAVKITAATNLDNIDKNQSTYNDTKATVYYGEAIEEACGGIKYYNYDHASVTITLSNSGEAESANLTFVESNGGDVHLYLKKEDKNANKVDNYAWTADGTCQRWVGFWDAVTGDDKATAAGTIIADTLVLVKNGMDFTVDIDDITIINPTPKKK